MTVLGFPSSAFSLCLSSTPPLSTFLSLGQELSVCQSSAQYNLAVLGQVIQVDLSRYHYSVTKFLGDS